MAFSAFGFKTLDFIGSVAGEVGTNVKMHGYAANDDAATVETANYFDPVIDRIQTGDLLDCSLNLAGVVERRSYVMTKSGGHVTIKRETDDDAAGGGVRAVIPTADGLTTGLILPGDSYVEAASADANHILTLPLASAATRGREIWIWVVPSTNCELRTPATSNQTINNVDSDASEALLTHTQLYVCRQHLATGWLLQAFTALGAVATAIVPD